MNEIAETILGIIGLMSVFVGIEFFFYWILDRFDNHGLSYILHGLILFLIVLTTLYPGE